MDDKRLILDLIPTIVALAVAVGILVRTCLRGGFPAIAFPCTLMFRVTDRRPVAILVFVLMLIPAVAK